MELGLGADGYDFEPFPEFQAAHETREWFRAWTGNPSDRDSELGGVDWISAVEWVPYQMSTFVTPAFAGYVSGHSTFSRAAAEVLTAMTGTPFFPGGLGTWTVPAGSFLFEEGPSVDVPLQWATYYDAADQAGLSRLYGGIHVEADDLQFVFGNPLYPGLEVRLPLPSQQAIGSHRHMPAGDRPGDRKQHQQLW